VPSFDAQLRLIESGVGVALLPEATARRAARTMAIEVLPLSDAYLNRRLRICVQRPSALPAHAQRAYSTPSRTAFHADGGQHSAVMADTGPR
jgi:DNA-binding transcriptional LysR family regulator